ncbi:MAG: twin-arginine translocase TatA/TatE family subunit [Candidatus Phaeomarinobacter sp.]
MGLSIWQILIVVVLVILLFGRGKISDLMGDVAQGIKSFRKGITDDAPEAKDDGKTIEGSAASEAQDAKTGETIKQ